MRQIIFDTETTGLDPAQGHRIVEIGCVELVNRMATGNNLHIYLNPDRDSDPEALAVHGLTTEFLSDKPRFADIADEFVQFIQGAELIAHNAAFDVKFFNAELARTGRGPISDFCETVTDSLLHARSLFPASATRWMRCATVSAFPTPTARCTAPCSTRSCWRKSGWP